MGMGTVEHDQTSLEGEIRESQAEEAQLPQGSYLLTLQA